MRNRHATAAIAATSSAIIKAVEAGMLTEAQGNDLFGGVVDAFTAYLNDKPDFQGDRLTLDNPSIAAFNLGTSCIIEKAEPGKPFDQE